MPVPLRRPLDFLVVADHSEYMGLYPMLAEGHPDLLASETGARWARAHRRGQAVAGRRRVRDGIAIGQGPDREPAFQRSVWDRVIDNAERYDDPGRFTAFIGYEWSSMPAGANLHRIVLFADGADKVAQVDSLPLDRQSRSRGTLALPRRLRADRRAAACWRSRITATSAPVACSSSSIRREALHEGLRRRSARAGSRSSRPPRSRATARRRPFSRPTTSSRTTAPGTPRRG